MGLRMLELAASQDGNLNLPFICKEQFQSLWILCSAEMAHADHTGRGL